MKKYTIIFAFLFALNIVTAQDLFSASRSNNIAEIEQLIADGNDVNEANERGFTPLILAVYNNNKEAAKVLLAKGANPQDKSGNTALMGASFRGFSEIATLLIENKTDINQINFSGASALIFAATFGQNEIAKQLITNGADLTLSDSRGKTAKDHAIMQDNKEMISLLSQ
ncbi:hypothetical protein SAMN05421738_10119 [Algoriella xinjiangensis]|uniref:Uncharacterized protein n=1 Tax=Algoriella xinjiangensis TaxID=684065 RepID=A0A1I4S295_9FLAO|nr:ankyrin repeat domain-containing protein [Algoriella xinjiangensis]SFM58666.1 hypothetical protein SAMN05421738_10119 [Algoriella xinjiangensis]